MRAKEYTFTYKDRSRVKSLDRPISLFSSNGNQILTPQPQDHSEINIELHNDHVKFQKSKIRMIIDLYRGG